MLHYITPASLQVSGIIVCEVYVWAIARESSQGDWSKTMSSDRTAYYTQESKAGVAASTELAQNKASKHSSQEGRGAPKPPPLA